MSLSELQFWKRSLIKTYRGEEIEELKEKGNKTIEKKQEELEIKIKTVITKQEDFFGPGPCQLLQYIDKTGSVYAASKQMGISYSKCWKLLNRIEEEMGFSFLNRYNGGVNGGASTITKEGREFMERYEALVEELQRESRRLFEKYFECYFNKEE